MKFNTFIFFLLILLAPVLSIVNANGWIVVPTFCVIICWVVSVICCLIYVYAYGIGSGLAKELKSKGKGQLKYVHGEWVIDDD